MEVGSPDGVDPEVKKHRKVEAVNALAYGPRRQLRPDLSVDEVRMAVRTAVLARPRDEDEPEPTARRPLLGPKDYDVAAAVFARLYNCDCDWRMGGESGDILVVDIDCNTSNGSVVDRVLLDLLPRGTPRIVISSSWANGKVRRRETRPRALHEIMLPLPGERVCTRIVVDLDEVRRLLACGYTYEDISVKMGVSTTTLRAKIRGTR